MRSYRLGLVALMLGGALALTGCHEPYHGESVSISYNSGGGYYHGRPHYGHGGYNRPVVVVPPRRVVVVEPPRHCYGHDRRNDRGYNDYDRRGDQGYNDHNRRNPGRYRDPGRY